MKHNYRENSYKVQLALGLIFVVVFLAASPV